MTGTWINAGAVVLGSIIGVLLKKGMPERINEAILKVEGLAIVIIGLNGVIAAMFTVNLETGELSDSNSVVLLVCLVLGCLVGELCRLDDHFNSLGMMVEKKLNAKGFAKGFVTASLLFCVGAMSIIGPLNDGLTGDNSILLIKSTLDFTISIVLASALGIGVLFSALPVLALQGSIALLARSLAPFITDSLLGMLYMVGYAIVIIIGLNFLVGTKIKTANLLPAIAVTVVYYFLFAR